jgi:hypothetical protein
MVEKLKARLSWRLAKSRQSSHRSRPRPCLRRTSRPRARGVLDDPQRRFVVSDFGCLEVLPKPIFHGNPHEVEFMQAILDDAESVAVSVALVQRALAMAGRYNLNPLDALHLAAAAEAGVDEMTTFEKPEKPICRQTELPVVSLRAKKRVEQS